MRPPNATTRAAPRPASDRPARPPVQADRRVAGALLRRAGGSRAMAGASGGGQLMTMVKLLALIVLAPLVGLTELFIWSLKRNSRRNAQRGRCPRCGGSVSLATDTCPHCGFPLLPEATA